ncbi:MAG TPA: maleylpyruvate isomerase family mycothiol-dependent enzyme [Streptomyces sp.]|uniref:maleylpyruvate isomerase family mycothiol-dependent enzyme n=1 Tax=Streptomyces sp. TaxID=1931 RepID=UPI002C3CD1FB|nr:maleylpyruvate isomerase family mycothiol-dependent enzyme [Streptomyces sp.]HWU06675.1 maleylpyruvate isomerase family mycothiol-dependent enzyme [Streptomyces sp.]
MTLLTYTRYCDEILAETGRLAELVKDADLTRRVPGCPDWNLRELVLHVGRAHRWAGEITRRRAAEEIPGAQVPGSGGPAGDDPAALAQWLTAGAATAVDALREAGPDTEVWTWGWERRTAFWARRMTHETVVHRGDAFLAAGAAFEVAPDLAADTITEWLEIVAFVQAQGDPEAAQLRGDGRSLHLHATDVPGAEWLIGLGEDGFTWRHAHEKATVALRGPLTELMLAFNRRQEPDEGGLEVLGDRELLDFWLERTSFG